MEKFEKHASARWYLNLHYWCAGLPQLKLIMWNIQTLTFHKIVSANGILPLFEHNGRIKFNYVMWWNTQFLFPVDCIACSQCTKFELALLFRVLMGGE